MVKSVQVHTRVASCAFTVVAVFTSFHCTVFAPSVAEENQQCWGLSEPQRTSTALSWAVQKLLLMVLSQQSTIKNFRTGLHCRVCPDITESKDIHSSTPFNLFCTNHWGRRGSKHCYNHFYSHYQLATVHLQNKQRPKHSWLKEAFIIACFCKVRSCSKYA